MADSTRRDRLRRRLQVIRHAPPEEALVAMLEPPTGELPAVDDQLVDEPAPDVSRETRADHPMAPFTAGGQVPDRPAFDPAAVAALQEEPPALSRARILKLEAATAQWVRDVREGGPGPDDTLLYAAPKPPPPPATQWRQLEEPAPEPIPAEEEARADELAARRVRQLEEAAAVRPPAAPPARVSDWVSRHDEASRAFPVAELLRRPVPVQDVLLDRGPILDQGTTPPLSVRDASACVGMAWAAAANVLRPDHHPLGVADARRLYELAQDLDHVAGHDYAGTSVLAGAKAAQAMGWIGSYHWGLRGTRDVAQALLQLQAPVVLGVPWSAGLEEPDRHGVIRPGGASAGGHALAAVGLVRRIRGFRSDVLEGPFFVLQQSRGEEEGQVGLVYLHHSDLARMLAGVGEAAVPLVGPS